MSAQWGYLAILKAIPIAGGTALHLDPSGSTETNLVYFWFPEFGDGFGGDNWGSTLVCEAAVAVSRRTWGHLKALYGN